MAPVVDRLGRPGVLVHGINIRPGKPTAEYLDYILSRITLPGALYLGIISILPNLFISNLIEERQQRQDGVLQEFTRTWGPEQSLYTPTLVIPYQAGERPRQYVKIAPTRLDLSAGLAQIAARVEREEVLLAARVDREIVGLGKEGLDRLGWAGAEVRQHRAVVDVRVFDDEIAARGDEWAVEPHLRENVVALVV